MSLELVRLIKADLEARGVDLSGACGAFEITKRVAWALRETGAGLHAKPTGNNCQGYSVDIVMYPGGGYVDCLRDAGGENEPTWNAHQGDRQFYRPAVDPGDSPEPEPEPEPEPDQDQDLSVVLAKLDELRMDVDTLRITVQLALDRPKPTIRWPAYKGTATHRLLGTLPIVLTPEP